MARRTKQQGEIFCHSCGEVIERSAQNCPHCGVRNAVLRSRSHSEPVPQPDEATNRDIESEVRDFVNEIKKIGDSRSSDQTRLEERISGIRTLDDMDRAINAYQRAFFNSPPETVWWKGVVGATVGWLAYLMATDLFLSFDFLFLIVFISWILLPVAIYEDSKIAPEYTVNWRPRTGLYIVCAAVPVVSAATGIIYLINRWYHGNNEELDDVDAVRQKYEQMIPEVNEVESDLPAEEQSSATTT